MRNFFSSIGLILICALPSDAAEWPTIHHDSQRSGYTGRQINAFQKRKWYRLFTDEMIATRVEAILAERNCYISTFAGNFYALNVKDGSTAWQFQAQGPIGASACYHGGNIFFGDDSGALYCLNANTGDKHWSYDAGDGIWVAPATDGQRLYFGDRGGTFHAVNLNTGEGVWRFETDGMILTPASISRKETRVVFASEDMHVYCLSTSGEKLWRSKKVGGLSLRDHAPTLWKGLAIVRTNPAKDFHNAAGTDPSLLTQTQKNIPMNEEDKVLFNKWGQYVMRLTPRRLRAERKAIRRYLKEHPAEKTFYAFRLEDGTEPWTAPILYTAGLHNPATPPTFHPKTGEMYVIYPTALGASRGSVPGGSISVGRLDRQTGNVHPIPPRGFPYPHFLQPADETQSLQLSGNRLLNTHQGSITGMALKDHEWKPIWTGRDTYGGIYGPSTLPNYWDDVESFMQKGYLVAMANEWHGPDRSIASIGYRRAFWVVGSMVVCIGGPNTPTQPSGGTKAPDPIKRRIDPVVPAGNVAAGVIGSFDRSVKKRRISAQETQTVLSGRPDRVAPPTTDVAKKLQADLEAEVTELIDQGRWAPFIVELGISQESRFFWRTSQTMQILALALPHLSPRVRKKAKAYLDGLFQSGAPLEQPIYQGLQGRRRELYNLGPTMKEFARHEPDYKADIEDLYAVWAYAYYAERWDRLRPIQDKLRNVFEQFETEEFQFNHAPNENAATQHLNAQIAGVLGFARIMQQFGNTQAASRATGMLTEIVTARIHHERADTRFVRKTERLHGAKIPRYVDLVPEVSSFLRRHARKALHENVRSITEQLPVWYQAFGERLIGGENYISPPHLARGLFAILADGLQAEPSELRQYIDQPWCHADLYYIEKLAAVLRQMHRERWSP